MTAADAHWQTALDWITLQHQGELTPERQAELAAWLRADPAHRQAYDEANRVWLITGLIPPST